MNNIEINGELEMNIENKYIKYKENVKFTAEEAIYILKRKDFCDEVENIAIENLIQENKELKEETTENQDYIKYLQKKLTNAIEIKYIHQDYIPKSKVKEKIEEIMNYTYSSNEERQKQNYAYDRLNELLEEGE